MIQIVLKGVNAKFLVLGLSGLQERPLTVLPVVCQISHFPLTEPLHQVFRYSQRLFSSTLNRLQLVLTWLCLLTEVELLWLEGGLRLLPKERSRLGCRRKHGGRLGLLAGGERLRLGLEEITWLLGLGTEKWCGLRGWGLRGLERGGSRG